MRKLLIYTLCIIAAALPASAKGTLDKYHETILELSVDENLAQPEVPKKQIPAIRERQSSMAKYLKGKGLTVEMARDGLAVVVTLPAEELFAANDTVVTAGAAKNLDLLSHYLKTPDLYKVLVVAHSDDTGTEEYLNSLTEARAEAIVQWMADRKFDTTAVIPYGFGADEPLEDNGTRQGRAANRRVEFYFVPGPVMIDRAKTGKL